MLLGTSSWLLGLLVVLLLAAPEPTSSKDLYAVLGVRRDATDKEIKKAYRREALENHPDKHAPFATPEDEKEATLLFVRIAKAYETLSDPERRRTYDLSGDDGHGSDGKRGDGKRRGGGEERRGNSGEAFGRTYVEAPFDLYAMTRGGWFHMHFEGKNLHNMPPTVVNVPVTLEQLLGGAVKVNITYSRAVLCSACGGTGHSSYDPPDDYEARPICPLCEGRKIRLHLYEDEFDDGGSGGDDDGKKGRGEEEDEDASKAGDEAEGGDEQDGQGHDHTLHRRGKKRPWFSGAGWRGFRQMVNTTCATCDGTGRMSDGNCSVCHGKRSSPQEVTMEVEVPTGAPDGLQIEHQGRGDEHSFRATGNLKIVVNVEQHRRFERSGDDLFVGAKCSLVEALLGFTDKKVTTLSGERLVVSHDGVAFTGFTKTFRGHGLPRFKRPDADPDRGADSLPPSGDRGETHGALVVRFSVVFPKRLTDDQRAVLAQVLGDEEASVLEALLRRMTTGSYNVPILSADEARFCRQCRFDDGALGGSADWCAPVPEYFTWWRAFGAVEADDYLGDPIDYWTSYRDWASASSNGL